MSAMGITIPQFNVPVCNSFQAKILDDQLCYEVDLNRFSNRSNIEKELKIGFSLLLDYNEDKQITFYQSNFSSSNKFSLGKSVLQSDEIPHAFIYLDTVGELISINFYHLAVNIFIDRAREIC